ncbi:MAG: winged helix-turn-helix domain-containing protein [Acidimicrobiales bacterium]|nr:winged helix-turn-helix domain-containing protein [Hyphomonadaceae bacterium]RZV41867.1 MAG: winged helix-turn-helix domain-containing protein [Acidimicrobiales bacterium]
MAFRIDNKTARRLWLATNGLATTPTGPLDVLQIVRELGFVQLDTIRNVTRAHHHILWSRNQNYREPMLWDLLAKDRSVFEHFTHDASILPMEFYPMWKRQFPRIKKKIDGSWYAGSDMSDAAHALIVKRIEQEGPLCTRAFDTKIKGEKTMWKRPPHKRALDYMWYCGELTTSHRENFIKFYDLSHRIIPEHHYEESHSEEIQIDWLCSNALNRLGFGSEGDIKRFWDATDISEVKSWAARKQDLVPVQIQHNSGDWTEALAPADIDVRLGELAKPTSRLRILNPFDPAIRDRDRLKRLFGFDYKIEIFVPAAKRKYGYYVYPLLEGDRFVGRIELKADRKKNQLSVHNLWLEPKIKWTPNRAEKLDAELARLGRLIGVQNIKWLCKP